MKKSVAVSVDGREPEELIDAYDVHPEVKTVRVTVRDVGDIVIEQSLDAIDMGGGIAFERKTPADWINSMKEGKLDRQVDQLRQRYAHAYLAYEGDLIDTDSPENSNIKPASIRGSMAKYNALGVKVERCSTTRLLADMTVRQARKHIEDTSLSYLETGPVGNGQPAPMRMYGCLPGVGKDTAEKLYERYPVPASLLSVDSKDLQQIDGIGETTAERIINMVRTDENGDSNG